MNDEHTRPPKGLRRAMMRPELFECLGSFLKRMEIYTRIPPDPIMTEVVVKVMVELLFSARPGIETDQTGAAQ